MPGFEYIYMNSKEPFSLEESEYASLWIRADTRIYVFALSEKNSQRKPEHHEETPISPPTYISPAPALDPTPSPPAPPLTAPDLNLDPPSS